jgi:ABC-type transporter Mla subunit MlaD
MFWNWLDRPHRPHPPPRPPHKPPKPDKPPAPSNDILPILARIEAKIDKYYESTIKEVKTIMGLVDQLTAAVQDLTTDVSEQADEVQVAVDALKSTTEQLKAALAAVDTAKDDPAIKSAIEALEAAGNTLDASTAKLRSGVEAITASGGGTTT